MNIAKNQLGRTLELKVDGRLDAYWADHLARAMEESIRDGAHHLRLNLAGVTYLSSAGIRVLLKFYKQLNAIQGSLFVNQSSENAAAVLELAGLAGLLKSAEPESEAAPKAAEPRRLERESGLYTVLDAAPGAALKCVLVGDPSKLEAGGYRAEDCRNQSYPVSTFGLGLGAFGNDFADCRERFGEFLAIEGVAAYLPSDGTNVPDYMVSEGLLVPELEVLYAVSGEGNFAHLVRFEAKPEPPGVVPLSELIEASFEAADSDAIGLVAVAESAGVVGAALKRSPAAQGQEASPLSFPAVRDWLSFTAERAHDRTVCVLVGIAARKEHPVLEPMLRPIRSGSAVKGHFHAAIFPYRPIQRGELDLHNTMNALFSSESILGLLHLVADDRPIDGIGESEFLRGACWVGPLADVTRG